MDWGCDTRMYRIGLARREHRLGGRPEPPADWWGDASGCRVPGAPSRADDAMVSPPAWSAPEPVYTLPPTRLPTRLKRVLRQEPYRIQSTHCPSTPTHATKHLLAYHPRAYKHTSTGHYHTHTLQSHTHTHTSLQPTPIIMSPRAPSTMARRFIATASHQPAPAFNASRAGVPFIAATAAATAATAVTASRAAPKLGRIAKWYAMAKTRPLPTRH